MALNDKAYIIFGTRKPGFGPDAYGWWTSAAADNDLRLEVLFADELAPFTGDTGARLLCRGKSLDFPKFVIMRAYAPQLSLLFESMGIPVFNDSASMQLCRDKLATALVLGAANIPVVPTYMPLPGTPFEEVAAQLRTDAVVVKPNCGSQGRDVYLARNAEEYAAATAKTGPDFIAQKYIASSHGRDLRVWVSNGEAVGAVVRSNPGKLASNYCQGGTATLYTGPMDTAGTLAVRAAGELGLVFAGVDLLFDSDGTLSVCEVNGNAGFRTLSACGGPDIVEIMVQDAIILSELKEMI